MTEGAQSQATCSYRPYAFNTGDVMGWVFEVVPVVWFGLGPTKLHANILFGLHSGTGCASVIAATRRESTTTREVPSVILGG